MRDCKVIEIQPAVRPEYQTERAFRAPCVPMMSDVPHRRMRLGKAVLLALALMGSGALIALLCC